LTINFVQDNQSSSNYGVIRGLHYQLIPYAQVKLISVLSGRILDVAVDIRKGSPTFGKVFQLSFRLKIKSNYLSRRICSWFSVLSEAGRSAFTNAIHFTIKKVKPASLYNDPSLSIDWKIPAGKEIVSEKIKITFIC
jgi:dTDP-4-dehydrorhamnose 3,5-epimerase